MAGLPETDWKRAGANLYRVLESAVAQAPTRKYVISGETSISYATFMAVVECLAADLEAQARGKSVAIFLPNSLAFLAAYFAVLRVGGKPALVNINTPPAAFDKLVFDFAPDLVIASAPIAGFTTRVVTDEDVIALSQNPTADRAAPYEIQPEDICATLFTGGTTGLPKRINHSHQMVVDAVDRMEWGWPTVEGEVWLPVAPFTHIYGYLMGVTNPMLKAGTIVLPPRFQPDLVVDLLAQHSVTVFGGGPPAIYQALMAAKNFGEADLSALKVCPGGGAPFPVALHENWQKATGRTIMEGYGMTEMAPISVNSTHSGFQFGSAGQPVPDVDIQIADLETGVPLTAAGQKGEVRIRGPHMMKGYEGQAEETAGTLRDGFVYTGDIGMLDEDGFLLITDRKKDVIFHKGFNVFPREVEEVLLQISGTQQACVVGLEDERSGEAVVAFVMSEGSLSEAAVRAHCAEHLSDYKVPAHICIEPSLPLTPNGKLDRVALRETAKTNFGA